MKERGLGNILVLISVVGLIATLVLLSTVEFKDKLFASIFPKPITQASDNCTATPTSLSDPLTKSIWDEFMGRRTDLGLPVYTWSNNLAQSAAWMAKDISINQSSSVPPTDLDSLGRNIRTRATNCGYRTDAQVWETSMFMWVSDPFGVIGIWQGNDAFRFFQALHSSTQYPPIYTTAALGYTHDSVSGKYFWVMNLGTLPDLGINPTPTPTAISGDIDKNGTVNIFDFNLVLTDFGKSDATSLRSDLNGNGTVDIFDFNLVITNFGRSV